MADAKIWMVLFNMVSSDRLRVLRYHRWQGGHQTYPTARVADPPAAEFEASGCLIRRARVASASRLWPKGNIVPERRFGAIADPASANAQIIAKLLWWGAPAGKPPRVMSHMISKEPRVSTWQDATICWRDRRMR